MRLTLRSLRSLLHEAVKKPKVYAPNSMVQATALRKGMIVSAAYNSFNTGVDIVEILGVGDHDKVIWDSVKEALLANNVRTLLAFDDLNIDAHYLWVKEIASGGTGMRVGRGRDDPFANLELTPEAERKSGPWYYPYEGRWARGSGAEKLSFRTLDVNDMKRLELDVDDGKPGNLLVSSFKEQNPSGDVLDFAWFIHANGHASSMPVKMRQAIDQASGYDQQTMKIQSVSDAQEVSHALMGQPEGEKNQWGSFNKDEDKPWSERSQMNYDKGFSGEALHAIAVDIVHAARAFFEK